MHERRTECRALHDDLLQRTKEMEKILAESQGRQKESRKWFMVFGGSCLIAFLGSLGVVWQLKTEVAVTATKVTHIAETLKQIAPVAYRAAQFHVASRSGEVEPTKAN